MFSNEMNRYMREFANWNSPQTVCLTFDQDWAPEYMIAQVLAILDEFDATATFLATNPSPLLIDSARKSVHEVGLHPNLAANSTQGDGIEDIIHGLRRTYPGSSGTRFHVLEHSYRDLMTLGRFKFEYDVSTFRFNCPYLLPAYHEDLAMTLLTYCWEDGYNVDGNLLTMIESIDIESPGVKIINFHPLNVFLNCAQDAHKAAFQQAVPDLGLSNREESIRFRHNGEGIEVLLRHFLKSLQNRGIRTVTLRELTRAFRDARD